MKNAILAIHAALPGDNPQLVKIRQAIVNLVLMAEKADSQLDFIQDRVRFFLDSPMEAVLDGILIEEAVLLAARLDSLGMECRVVARDLKRLSDEYWDRKIK